MDAETTLYSGEAQLAGWSDTHTGGVKVTLWLPDPKALEPFRAMTVRKGNVAGQVLMVAMVEVNDDGQPVRQPRPPQRLSQVAVMMCANPEFWRWCREELGVDVTDEAGAAEFMRAELEVQSRSELDTREDRARYFHENIRRPFAAWKG